MLAIRLEAKWGVASTPDFDVIGSWPKAFGNMASQGIAYDMGSGHLHNSASVLVRLGVVCNPSQNSIKRVVCPNRSGFTIQSSQNKRARKPSQVTGFATLFLRRFFGAQRAKQEEAPKGNGVCDAFFATLFWHFCKTRETVCVTLKVVTPHAHISEIQTRSTGSTSSLRNRGFGAGISPRRCPRELVPIRQWKMGRGGGAGIFHPSLVLAASPRIFRTRPEGL
jgi:hypothetical protein